MTLDRLGREITVEVKNEDETIVIFDWPFCEIDGCTNRRSLRLYSIYCHPHTILHQEKFEYFLEEEFIWWAD